MNSRPTLVGDALTGMTPVSAHLVKPLNCSPDSPKSLVNARKRSQTLMNSRPTLVGDALTGMTPVSAHLEPKTLEL